MILDGGLATWLQHTHGLAPFTPVTPWLDAHPERIAQAHGDFVDEGAEAVLSATFRVLPHLDPHWRNHALTALELARASGTWRVFASVGPPGEPGQAWDGDAAGLVALAELYAAQPGLVGLVLETFTSADELAVVVDAVRPAFPGTLVASLSPGPTGLLWDGSTPEAALERIRALDVDAVGFNCGPGCIAAASRCRAAGVRVDWLKPNRSDGEIPDDLLRDVAYVGGCCGTTPADIAELVDRIRALSPPSSPGG